VVDSVGAAAHGSQAGGLPFGAVRKLFAFVAQAWVQYAQEFLEMNVSERWRRLSLLQIRLTKLALLAADVLALLLSAWLAAALAHYWGRSADADWLVSQDAQRYLAWLAVAGVGLGLFLVRFRHYSDRKPFWSELGETLMALMVLAVLDLAVLALTRWNSSRLWWAFVWPLAMVGVPLARALAREVMRRIGVWQRPTLIVGNGPNAYEAVAALQSEPTLGFVAVGFIDPLQAPGAIAKKLKQWVKVPGVQFVLALEHGQNDLREDLLRRLAHWKAEDVSVVPAMRGVPLFGTDMSYFFSHEVAMLKLRNNLRYWPARLLKRMFDVLAALLLLLLLLPLFAYLMVAIRKDGGPAVFAHQRVGQGGKTFACYKFRSMCIDAEKELHKLLASNPKFTEQWAREFKLKDDPRITPIGRFLRSTSLDELPQIFNVIKGDMSLVGPRPVVKAELIRYGDDVDYFLMVRPGMTGLWQVSGRNDVDYDTRVYLDTWYVKNWSLWYDIAILFKTINVVFKREGAY
jgi:Undecaprenyl-phosphate galactose phosphotransferase WbaP